MKNTNLNLACAGLALIGGLLVPADACSAPSTRVFRANPTAFCQGALPAFETAIRKRPLAVQNEGTTNAFVTCSFLSQGSIDSSTTNPNDVLVYFNSVSGTNVPISCTGVSGYAGGANEFVVKSVIVPANGQAQITWNSADFAGAPANFPSGLFSISCNLPPGGAINDTRMTFREEIGT